MQPGRNRPALDMCFKKATQEKTGVKTRVLGLNISCCIVGAEKEVINARYCAAATLAEAPRLARVLHDVLTHILEHLQLLRRQYLYFCASKASKLGSNMPCTCSTPRAVKSPPSSFKVSLPVAKADAAAACLAAASSNCAW